MSVTTQSATPATMPAGTVLATVDTGGGVLGGVVSVFGTVAVTGTFFQATQPVSIAASVGVTGTFWQATQPVSLAATVAVSGPLTDTQLRATAVPVSGTFWQTTQPVSIAGTVTTNTGLTQPLTDTQLRATAVPVSIATMPSTPVTGTFWQAAQPITDNSGSLTVDAPVATPVFVRLSDGAAAITTLPVSLASAPTTAVTGTFWQATQPVSLATNTPDVTDRAGRLLGVVTNANIDVALSTRLKPADTLTGVTTVGTVTTVSTVTAVTSITNNVTTTPATPTASANTHLNVSLGSTTGKAAVLKTGNLVTTATTPDQVVLTYTVTAGKTLYLQYISLQGRLTVAAATATILGALSVETPSGTKVYTIDLVNPTTSALDVFTVPIDEPVPIAAAAVVRIVVTPAAATSMTWKGSFGGYER